MEEIKAYKLSSGEILECKESAEYKEILINVRMRISEISTHPTIEDFIEDNFTELYVIMDDFINEKAEIEKKYGSK